MRKRIGDNVPLRFSLEPVITNGAGGPERFLDVSLFERPSLLCMMGPNARQEIGLEFEPHRKPIGFRFAQSLAGRIDLIHRSQEVLDVVADFMCDDIRLGKIPWSLKARL